MIIREAESPFRAENVCCSLIFFVKFLKNVRLPEYIPPLILPVMFRGKALKKYCRLRICFYMILKLSEQNCTEKEQAYQMNL